MCWCADGFALEKSLKRLSSVDVEAIQLPRAFQAVASSISKKVMSGEWPIGTSLPGEWALAEAFGVTRSTVREAIRVLEQDGLLIRPRGTKQLVVNAPTGLQVSSRMTAVILLQQVSFLELWETMMAIEPSAAEAAARHATPDQLAALDENQRLTAKALRDPPRLLELDLAFMNGVAEASGNRALLLCRSAISDLLYRAFLPVLRRAPAGERLFVAHQHILAALHAGDGEKARRWMERHCVDFRRGYERAGLDINLPVARIERAS